MEARLACIETLLKVVRDQQSLTAAIEMSNVKISAEHIPRYQQMCYGLLRHYYSLQSILTSLLTKPLPAKHLDIKLVLLLGLYQILHMKVPDHAAVNQSVEMSKALGKNWAGGLVNAVLRRFLREQSECIANLENDPVFHSDHPRWLIANIQSAWPQQSEAIFVSNNHQAPLTLRVNRQAISRENFLGALAAAGIISQPCYFSSDGVTLQVPMDVSSIPGFTEGWFSVQDEASQIAAGLLNLTSSLSVLDACAAPGGKSCHILESAPGINLLSLEVDSNRSLRIVENAKRLGLAAQVVQGDALTPQSWWSGQQFDRILLDAPCTATGIIRRHPDIKLLRKSSDVDKLASQQSALLGCLWPLLKKDGLLVYSTCSILPEENHLPVTNFISHTADAVEMEISETWGIRMPVGRQLLPVVDGHDGFYYARLRKV
jgi:16S rRNA (cytosine967-C5)-methyltransferase